jgi:hypothetical protein
LLSWHEPESFNSKCPATHTPAPAQAAQLREFNRRGDPEAVIRAFEGGAAVSSEETLGEYVKALVKVDRLDSSSLLQTLQVTHASCGRHQGRLMCITSTFIEGGMTWHASVAAVVSGVMPGSCR